MSGWCPEILYSSNQTFSSRPTEVEELFLVSHFFSSSFSLFFFPFISSVILSWRAQANHEMEGSYADASSRTLLLNLPRGWYKARLLISGRNANTGTVMGMKIDVAGIVGPGRMHNEVVVAKGPFY